MYCLHCMHRLPEGSSFCTACGHRPTPDTVMHHLRPGTVLNGRYLIGKAIGEGGFGITYIGLDTNLDLKVAVKEFFPLGFANRNCGVTNEVTLNYSKEYAYYSHAKQHFLDEAKNIAKFSKEEAVVDVREYFEENNTAYIVMEYVDGMTLSQYLKRNGRFSADKILSLMTPLMQALQKMHRASVIHRDISPDNIMITDDGKLKLMDFGSARYYEGDRQKTLSVVLKPGYAPFEQYSSKGNQGPWTDVYALCATIYKCITGVTPPDAMDRCQQDLLQSPSAMGVMISPAFENALMRGLEVYPQNRLSSIEALFSALAPKRYSEDPDMTVIADDYGTPPPADRTYGDSYNRYSASQPSGVPRKKRSAAPIVIAVIAAVLIVGGIVAFLLLRQNSDHQGDVTGNAAATLAPTEAPVEETSDPDVVSMPDVVGKKLSDAQSQLENLGLKSEVSREYSDSVAKDYVIRQGFDSGRELRKGDTVMLYVSDGSPTEAPTEAPTQPAPTQAPTIDVESEVEHIRALYYATQADPGAESSRGGATYYEKDGSVTKIVCESGLYGWDYSRNYFYENGELYFAFVYDGAEEHRLYFLNGTLIRYIDENGSVMDYGSISCPFETKVTSEADQLIQ